MKKKVLNEKFKEEIKEESSDSNDNSDMLPPKNKKRKIS